MRTSCLRQGAAMLSARLHYCRRVVTEAIAGLTVDKKPRQEQSSTLGGLVTMDCKTGRLSTLLPRAGKRQLARTEPTSMLAMFSMLLLCTMPPTENMWGQTPRDVRDVSGGIGHFPEECKQVALEANDQDTANILARLAKKIVRLCHTKFCSRDEHPPGAWTVSARQQREEAARRFHGQAIVLRPVPHEISLQP
eukprot:764888-Hanusia_phi.AAC.4